MTRETKIGLLVGLAFIIVIGILLSDHFSTATQPPQSLVAPTENVLESTRAPGASRQLPPLLQEIQPNRPIQIEADRNTLVQPNESIFVGPNRSAGQRQVEVYGQHVQPIAPAHQEPIHSTTPQPNNGNLFGQGNNGLGNALGGGVIPPTFTNPPIHTTPLVNQPMVNTPQAPFNVPQQGANTNSNTNANANTNGAREPEFVPVPDQNAFAGPVRQYTAQENDTVSKMALKFLGSKSKANMDLIIKANPSLIANPHKIVVGKQYNIPVAAAPTQTAATSANGVGTAANPSPAANTGVAPAILGTVPAPFTLTPIGEVGTQNPQPATPAAASAEVAYTTRTGDTLWSIARNELGSASPAVLNQIFEMNRGVLKSKDKVPSNVVLKLPAKAVAAVAN